ncbi:MAG: adenylate/guanylate cyclase domain-containing protein, partial [Candidatus Bipolaricaulis sp.]|nr:adenylate/guanylate cyclase domain-containing protein [Candidatus Bipolaricaulis sp.]
MERDTRQLAAIMLTDIVGYTALTQVDEALTLALLEEHASLLRPLFAEHSGREIKGTGDGFLVEFPSALEAVRCAIEIQRALHERNSAVPLDRTIQVRIGVHLGDVVHRGSDIFGDGVNITARIEPLAEPGGICL